MFLNFVIIISTYKLQVQILHKILICWVYFSDVVSRSFFDFMKIVLKHPAITANYCVFCALRFFFWCEIGASLHYFYDPIHVGFSEPHILFIMAVYFEELLARVRLDNDIEVYIVEFLCVEYLVKTVWPAYYELTISWDGAALEFFYVFVVVKRNLIFLQFLWLFQNHFFILRKLVFLLAFFHIRRNFPVCNLPHLRIF